MKTRRLQPKSLPARPQLAHQIVEHCRCRGRQPGSEGKDLTGLGPLRDQPGVSLDLRLGAGFAPGYDYLRLNGEKNLGAIEL